MKNVTKQTAMQELIEYIESNEIVYNKDLILKLKELLEKEKEQIIDFSMQMHKIDCSNTGTDILKEEAEQYYNQTYNK